ncbi:CRISPR-associated endoribonuclease Cas6 [Candidatus Chrysopegis kryptomonas]|uniref:CRISPR-associated endoribonuclease Cas6 n=1 Tax=Candidatus Chryseopegocella kryptomonas TaxID=1633643 RepID=A0A0P1MTV4_9BACT|nr:CRISPR-associated endoribonuclease Cas6 [Candidatus Chrysopegis kryptomonas]CUS99370.1 CRISPR-associated endoribonuclease Cas6 [Candidatus Chrysopegis kryptomonas]
MLKVVLEPNFIQPGNVFSLPLDYRTGFMSIIKSAFQSESPIDYDLVFNRRTVKPYTFAVAFGDDVKVQDEKIYFNRPLEFKFSSFDLNDEILLYNYFVRSKTIKIFGRDFDVSNLWIFENKKIKGNSAIFKTLSPVLIRSHKNEKFYLCPKCENFDGDEAFYEALKFNVSELVRNLLGREVSGEINFKPVKTRRVVVKHLTDRGNLKLPGFTGLFLFEAESEVLNLILRAGLGARRSQGFGMLELVYEVSR